MDYTHNQQNNSETPQPMTADQHENIQSRKRLGCLGIIGLITVVAGLFFAASIVIIMSFAFFYAGDAMEGSSQVVEEDVQFRRGISDKIVIIDIKGLIHSGTGIDGATTGKIINQLEKAQQDPSVQAVVLDMNTPGGEVTASDEVNNAVRRLRAADIPVVACMRSVCASGGYYIATAADYIVAHPTTLTGSIGVRIPQFNYNQLLEKLGIQHESFSSGEMKDMLSGAVEKTTEEKRRQSRILQKLVDQTFDKFLQVIADGRKSFKNIQEVREADFTDGRVLLAEEAVEADLVDSIGYFNDAIAKARQLSSAQEANVVRYRRAFSLTDILSPLTTKREINLKAELLPGEMRLSPYQLYYLTRTLHEK